MAEVEAGGRTTAAAALQRLAAVAPTLAFLLASVVPSSSVNHFDACKGNLWWLLPTASAVLTSIGEESPTIAALMASALYTASLTAIGLGFARQTLISLGAAGSDVAAAAAAASSLMQALAWRVTVLALLHLGLALAAPGAAGWRRRGREERRRRLRELASQGRGWTGPFQVVAARTVDGALLVRHFLEASGCPAPLASLPAAATGGAAAAVQSTPGVVLQCLGALLLTSWGTTALAVDCIWVLWPWRVRPAYAEAVNGVATWLAALIRAALLVLLAAPTPAPAGAGSAHAASSAGGGQAAVTAAAVLLANLMANGLSPSAFGMQSAAAAVLSAALHWRLDSRSLPLAALALVYGSMWLAAAVFARSLARARRPVSVILVAPPSGPPSALASVASATSPTVFGTAGVTLHLSGEHSHSRGSTMSFRRQGSMGPSGGLGKLPLEDADDSVDVPAMPSRYYDVSDVMDIDAEAEAVAAATAAAIVAEDEGLQALFGPDASADTISHLPPSVIAQTLASAASIDSGARFPSVNGTATAAAIAAAAVAAAAGGSGMASPRRSGRGRGSAAGSLTSTLGGRAIAAAAAAAAAAGQLPGTRTAVLQVEAVSSPATSDPIPKISPARGSQRSSVDSMPRKSMSERSSFDLSGRQALAAASALDSPAARTPLLQSPVLTGGARVAAAATRLLTKPQPPLAAGSGGGRTPPHTPGPEEPSPLRPLGIYSSDPSSSPHGTAPPPAPSASAAAAARMQPPRGPAATGAPLGAQWGSPGFLRPTGPHEDIPLSAPGRLASPGAMAAAAPPHDASRLPTASMSPPGRSLRPPSSAARRLMPPSSPAMQQTPGDSSISPFPSYEGPPPVGNGPLYGGPPNGPATRFLSPPPALHGPNPLASGAAFGPNGPQVPDLWATAEKAHGGPSHAANQLYGSNAGAAGNQLYGSNAAAAANQLYGSNAAAAANQLYGSNAAAAANQLYGSNQGPAPSATAGGPSPGAAYPENSVLSSTIIDADMYDRLLSSASSPFLLNPANAALRGMTSNMASNMSTALLPPVLNTAGTNNGSATRLQAVNVYRRQSSSLSEASWAVQGGAVMGPVATPQASGAGGRTAPGVIAASGAAPLPPPPGPRGSHVPARSGGQFLRTESSTHAAVQETAPGSGPPSAPPHPPPSAGASGVSASGASGGGAHASGRGGGGGGGGGQSSRPSFEGPTSQRQVITLPDGRQVYQSETLAAAASSNGGPASPAPLSKQLSALSSASALAIAAAAATAAATAANSGGLSLHSPSSVRLSGMHTSRGTYGSLTRSDLDIGGTASNIAVSRNVSLAAVAAANTSNASATSAGGGGGWNPTSTTELDQLSPHSRSGPLGTDGGGGTGGGPGGRYGKNGATNPYVHALMSDSWRLLSSSQSQSQFHQGTASPSTAAGASESQTNSAVAAAAAAAAAAAIGSGAAGAWPQNTSRTAMTSMTSITSGRYTSVGSTSVIGTSAGTSAFDTAGSGLPGLQSVDGGVPSATAGGNGRVGRAYARASLDLARHMHDTGLIRIGEEDNLTNTNTNTNTNTTTYTGTNTDAEKSLSGVRALDGAALSGGPDGGSSGGGGNVRTLTSPPPAPPPPASTLASSSQYGKPSLSGWTAPGEKWERDRTMYGGDEDRVKPMVNSGEGGQSSLAGLVTAWTAGVVVTGGSSSATTAGPSTEGAHRHLRPIMEASYRGQGRAQRGLGPPPSRDGLAILPLTASVEGSSESTAGIGTFRGSANRLISGAGPESTPVSDLTLNAFNVASSSGALLQLPHGLSGVVMVGGSAAAGAGGGGGGGGNGPAGGGSGSAGIPGVVNSGGGSAGGVFPGRTLASGSQRSSSNPSLLSFADVTLGAMLPGHAAGTMTPGTGSHLTGHVSGSATFNPRAAPSAHSSGTGGMTGAAALGAAAAAAAAMAAAPGGHVSGAASSGNDGLPPQSSRRTVVAQTLAPMIRSGSFNGAHRIATVNGHDSNGQHNGGLNYNAFKQLMSSNGASSALRGGPAQPSGSNGVILTTAGGSSRRPSLPELLACTVAAAVSLAPNSGALTHAHGAGTGSAAGTSSGMAVGPVAPWFAAAAAASPPPPPPPHPHQNQPHGGLTSSTEASFVPPHSARTSTPGALSLPGSEGPRRSASTSWFGNLRKKSATGSGRRSAAGPPTPPLQPHDGPQHSGDSGGSGGNGGGGGGGSSQRLHRVDDTARLSGPMKGMMKGFRRRLRSSLMGLGANGGVQAGGGPAGPGAQTAVGGDGR
ncbi:hypothetical protein HYH03_017398 [Edaphochlamys debaryana]|uniref:Uncharacterized protein n=1 Tax=Edaphochlamys debaryana TaxID=47281 RepID=A0A835XJ39_9CHLO|nr:hypothetical protein HYH03_017398 [Edaphochlamys debaryana]|eukprot:KAG2483743.1 hypothetical protein HYH03_017398 [Edaphochlamys debaryana]